MTRRPKKTPGAIDGIAAAAAIGIETEAIEAEAVRTGDFSKLDALTGKLYGAAAQATKKPLTPTPDEKATIDALKYATRLARASWLERGISEGVRAKRLRHLNRLFWLLDNLDPALLPKDEDQDGSAMPARGKRRWMPRAPSALQRRAALIRAGVDLDRQPFDFAGAVAPMAGDLLRRRRC